MTWLAVAAGGATVLGAGISYAGSQKAAKTSAKGSDAANAEAARQFNLVRSDTAPYRAIGNQALNALGSIYGYSSGPQVSDAVAGATPYQYAPIETGFGNEGASAALNPWSVTSKLGGAGKILDPAGGLFGNVFATHGDEKRNLQAFAAESGVKDLGNGMLMLPDGSTFSQGQLKDVAGTWYGAMHAPDGNQADWQNRYTTLLGGLQKTPGVGQTPNAGAGGSALTAPDYSAFFKSPDYQFRKDQGMQGIGNAFSASGGAKSGNALKALAEFNSNLAAGEFGNYFNRQAALAGLGQTATGQSGSAGIATGQLVGNALQNSSNARASGVAGQYNAIGAGLSGLSQGLGYYMQQRQVPQSGYGGFGPQANNWGYGNPVGSYA